MPIRLDEDRKSYPSVKFSAKGQFVNIAVARLENVDLKEYGTDRVMMGANGKPRQQTRLTGYVLSGNAQIRDGETTREPNKDEVVSVYLKRQARWEFFQAKNKLDGGLQCGDLVHVKYERDESGERPGTTKKVYTVATKRGDDTVKVASCERLYNELKGATVLDDEPASQGSYAPSPDEYDPFADE